MARNQLARILTSKTKGVANTSKASGVLSRLWRQILLDLNIGPARFGDYMRDFVSDIRNGYPPTRRDQTSARGNLTKEFSRDGMTIKVFIKALKFLQIVKVEFALKLYHRNGRTSVHGTEINLGTRVDVNRFLEELEEEEDVDVTDEDVRTFFTAIAQSTMFPFDVDADEYGYAEAPKSSAHTKQQQAVTITADIYESRTFPDGRIEPTFGEGSAERGAPR